MTTLTIQRPEGTLVADRIGSGPAILLVHGLGDSRTSYRHLVDRLADAGFTVYNLDIRGHGDSSTTFSSYTTEDIATDMIALLDQEGLTRATLVGNSIAGGAAAWAAANHPDRITDIVLLNPFVRDMPADRYFRPLVPFLFARPWGAAMWMMYRKSLYISPPDDQEQASADFGATLADPERLAAVRSMIRATKAAVGARLGEVEARTLVIMGDKDPDYTDPTAEGHTLVGLLGGPTQLEVIAQSGHYPQTEHPEAVAALIVAHIAAGAPHGA